MGIAEILMGIGAVAITAIGIAVTVYFSPCLLVAMAAGACIGAGMSGISAAFSKDITWEKFFKNMAIGAVIGAVSSMFSMAAYGVAGNLGARFGLGRIAQFVLTAGSVISMSTIGGVTTNGFMNWYTGRNLFHNWKKAAITGAIVGTLSVLCHGWNVFKYNADRAEQLAKAMTDSAASQQQGGAFQMFTRFMDQCYRQNVVKIAVDMGVSSLENIAVQLATTGTIEWKMVAFSALIAGGLSLARAGMQAYKKRQNDKLIKETFEHNEDVAQRNADERKRIDDLRKQKAASKRAKKNGSETASLPPTNDGPTKKDAPECVAGVRVDGDGKISKGVNHNQRVKDEMAKIHHDQRVNEEMAKIQKIQKTPKIKQKLPYDKFEAAGNDIQQHKQMTAEKRALLTSDRNNLPMANACDSNRNRQEDSLIHNPPNPEQRACSEAHAITNRDKAVSHYDTPLKDHTLFTVGPGDDGLPYVKGPCDTCKTIPDATNLSLANNLTSHLDRRFDVETIRQPYYMPASENLSSDGIVGDLMAAEKLIQKLTANKEKAEGESVKQNVVVPQEQITHSDAWYGGGERACTASTPGTSNNNQERFHELSDTNNKTNIRGTDFHSGENEYEAQSLTAGLKKRVGEVFKAGMEKIKGKVKAKMASVFPLVMWNDEKNKYQMTDHKSWPRFPQDGVRLVGVTGIHGSGKTSLVHSLVFDRGYALTEMQVLTTRMRMGINLYILPDDNIAFLDCCDSLDATGDEQASSTPIGALMLELFTYLSCGHLLLSIPVEEHGLTADNIRQLVRKRLQLLPYCGSFLDRFGCRAISVVLRSFNPSDEMLSQWKALGREFLPPTAESEVCDEENLKKEVLSQEDMFATAFHDVDVLSLRFRNFGGDSVSSSTSYEKEFSAVRERIEDYTGFHFARFCKEYMDDADKHLSVCETLITIWNEICDSEELKKVVASTSNKDQATKFPDAEVQRFFESVESFRAELEASAECPRLERNIEEYYEWCKTEGEKFNNAAEEDKDQMFLIRAIQKISHIILYGSKDIANLELKEKGIGVGLRGFVVLLKDDERMKLMALRMAVLEFDLISLLNDPMVYRNYSTCWHILVCLARTGFRVPLLVFDTWKIVTDLLSQSELVGTEKQLIYRNALVFLETLLSDSPPPVLPLPEQASANATANKIITAQEVEQISYCFELENKALVEKSIQEALKDKGAVSRVNEELLKLPRVWFDSSPYAQRKQIDFEEAPLALSDKITITNFAMIFKVIGLHFATEIITKEKEFATRKHELTCPDAIGIRLNIFQRIAGFCENNPSMLLSVFRSTNLRVWLLKEFLHNSSDRNYADALKATTQLLYASQEVTDVEIQRQIMEQGFIPMREESTKVNQLADVHRRDRRRDQITRWGLLRLQILESQSVKTAVNSFCDQDITPKKLQTHFHFMIWCLVYGKDDEENSLSANIFVAKREQLLAKISVILKRQADVIADAEEQTDSEEVFRALQIISAGCDFVNRFMALFCKLDFEGFYESVGNSAKQPIQQIPSWIKLADACLHLYQSLSVRRMQLKNLMKTTESVERLNHATSSFLQLLFNISSTSGISLATVFSETKIRQCVTLTDLSEPEKPNILESKKDFSKLQLKDKTHYDMKNVLRCAYILSLSGETFTVVLMNVEASFIGLWRYTCDQLNAHRAFETFKEQEIARRKRLGTGDGSISVDRHRLFAPRNDEQTESAPKKQITAASRACDSVLLTCAVVDHPLPADCFKERLEMLMNENYGGSETMAQALLLAVFSGLQSEVVKTLKKHFKNMQQAEFANERHFTLKKSNAAWVQVLAVKFGRKLLQLIGYEEQIQDGEPVLKTSRHRIGMDEIALFLDVIESADEDSVKIALYNPFEEVFVRGEDEMRKQTLPPSFFNTENQTVREQLASKTIEELIQMNAHSDPLLRNVGLRFVLVRIELPTGKMWQAMFNTATHVSQVIDNLNSETGTLTGRLLRNGEPERLLL